MASKKWANPLLLVVGLVAGVAGAVAMSDPKIKKKSVGTIKSVFARLTQLASDADRLNNQKGLDGGKKTTAKAKK